ncbi:unnamed protein product [Urochloa humidicola]
MASGSSPPHRLIPIPPAGLSLSRAAQSKPPFSILAARRRAPTPSARLVPLSLPFTTVLQYSACPAAPTRRPYLAVAEAPRPHVCDRATGFGRPPPVGEVEAYWGLAGFGGPRRNKRTQFATPAKGAPGARNERSGAERFVASGGGDDRRRGRRALRPPCLACETGQWRIGNGIACSPVRKNKLRFCLR